MFPPNYNQIPLSGNGQPPQARIMTQQPENFSGGIPSAAAAEAARQQQAAAEAQAREGEKRFLALLQQTVDSRLQGFVTFLEQAKERIESLERGLGETMAYVQTLNPQVTGPLTPNEQRVLLLVQSGVMTKDEARQALGLGSATNSSPKTVVTNLAEKKKPGRPSKKVVAVPSVEQTVLDELNGFEN